MRVASMRRLIMALELTCWLVDAVWTSILRRILSTLDRWTAWR